jgi:hypothetical protein
VVKKFPLRLLYVAVAIFLTSCGNASRRIGEQGLDPNREVSVTVKNENFYDATVYACRGTMQDRLGVVTSSTTRKFKFRWVTADLRFLVDFTGGGRFLTTLLQVETGDELDFVITINFNRGLGNARCV